MLVPRTAEAGLNPVTFGVTLNVAALSGDDSAGFVTWI
jgi:hypothetical protein